MYIGGFDKWKGVDTLFELAKSTINEFSVYVIGGTEEVIEKYKEKFPNVHFLGAMPYRDLHNNQQSADILVIPNTAKNKLSAEYTSPLKLFAYMTSKLPIVASDIKSLRNVLGNNTCVYFEPDNSESLKIAINKVISDIDLRHKITDSAFELSKKYTWRSRAKDILDFIN